MTSKYYSDAQKRATAKYKAEKYKRVPFDVPIPFYEETIKPAVEQSGMSLNGFLKEAVLNRIEKGSAPDGFVVQMPPEDLERYEKEARDRDMDLQEMILLALQEFIKNN